MRMAIGLEYDGNGFCGWQTQPGGGAVQNAVEQALTQMAGHEVTTVCAGRTDAGVHALAQVIHFDTAVHRPVSAWVRGVNALLPGSIAVLWAKPVPEDFHARFSAVERCYRYLLLNHPLRPALYRARAGWFHQPLDLERMREAAECLIGEHDFSGFRAAECQARSAVKCLHRLDIARAGDFLVFELRANAFLHHMVRNIVGCLVYVGKGKHSPDWVKAVLESRDRKLAAPTFPAAGLYLAEVRYAEKWGIPEGARSFFPLAKAGPGSAR